MFSPTATAPRARTIVALAVTWGAVVVSGVVVALNLIHQFRRGRLGFEVVMRNHLVHSDGPAYLVADRFTLLGNSLALVVFTAAIAAIAFVTRSWWRALFALIAVGGAVTSTMAIKVVTNRLSETEWDIYGLSFPSGHATAGVAICLTSAALLAEVLPTGRARRGVWIAATVLVAGVGWSRVAVGAHWVGDSLGGVAVAVVWLGAAYVLTPARVHNQAPRPAPTVRPADERQTQVR